MGLRAVVIGTGWAGEGHTRALLAAHVEIAAICGRTSEPARALAQKLGISEVRLDWRQALRELKPDIVSIATPAAAHAEIGLIAAAQGCHIVCEIPLGMNGAEAQAMLKAVEAAQVKHAITSTPRYTPAALYARSLLADGLIGEVREIEAVHHFNASPLLPFSWFHQEKQGGGALNFYFYTFLNLALFITGGALLAASGEGRHLIDRAPVGEALHDMREGFVPLDADKARTAPWQVVDVDTGYTAGVQLRMPQGNTANALFQGSVLAAGRYSNGVVFYGDKGALSLPGYFVPEALEWFDPAKQSWIEVSIPEEIRNAMECSEDPSQNAWCLLYRQFIAAIYGQAHLSYPDFRDGWVACRAVEIVRQGSGWQPLIDSLES